MSGDQIVAALVVLLVVAWLYMRMARAGRRGRPWPKVRRDHTGEDRLAWFVFFWW
jgi:uncharacterized protein HemY